MQRSKPSQRMRTIEGTLTWHMPAYHGPLTPAQRYHLLRRNQRQRLVLGWGSVVLLLCAALGVGVLSCWWWAPATITVHLAALRSQRQITIVATAHPVLPTESRARVIRVTQRSSVEPVVATGRQQQAATQARGVVTWYNQQPSPQTIPAGTRIRVSDALTIITDSAVVVPTGNAPALGESEGPAHVLTFGSRGNIPAGTITSFCPCSPVLSGLLVTNRQAFVGGHDAAIEHLVLTQDINRAVVGQGNSIQRATLTALLHQLSPTAGLLQAPGCVSQVVSTLSAGSSVTPGLSPTAFLTVSCTANVFDRRDVFRRAITSFVTQVSFSQASVRGSSQVRFSATLPQITRDTQHGEFRLTLTVTARWTADLSQQACQRLRHELSGTSPAQAERLLLRLPGVQAVTIEQVFPWRTLPTDPQRLTIRIQT